MQEGGSLLVDGINNIRKVRMGKHNNWGVEKEDGGKGWVVVSNEMSYLVWRTT